MPRYYDIVLGLIPLLIIGVAVTLTVAGFNPLFAAATGGAVSASVVGHALFFNPPGDLPQNAPGDTTR